MTSLSKIPDVLIISETWIQQSQTNYFSLDGFSSYLAGRDRRRGGGVGIFIRNNWGTNRILKIIMKDYIEVLVVEVKLPGNTFRFLAIYRPPKTLNLTDQQIYLNDLENIISEFDGPNTLIIGDQNIDLFDMNDIFVQNYNDILHQNRKVVFNRIMISRPSSGTCNDHIVVDYSITEKLRIQTSPFHYLDHLAMVIDVSLVNVKPSSLQTTYSVKKFIDYNELTMMLPNRLSHIHNNMEMNNLFDETVRVIRECSSLCTKVKVFKFNEKFKRPWMDEELLTNIEIKEYWFRLMNDNPREEFYNSEYKKWRNIVTNMKRMKMQAYYESKFDTCNGDKQYLVVFLIPNK